MPATSAYSHSWKHFLGSTLAYWYTVFLGWTTRIYWFKTPEAQQIENEGKGLIYAVWHNQQLFLLYPYKGQKLRRLSAKAVTGNTSPACCPNLACWR